SDSPPSSRYPGPAPAPFRRRAASPGGAPSSRELAHGIVETVQAQGIHAALHQAVENLQGMDMLPAPFRPRVDPDGALEMADQSLHPGLARLLVPMLDGTAGLRDLIGAHGSVADEDQAPIRTISPQ